MFEPPNCVQIRVSIVGIKPEIWRRIVVPAHWNLEQLHLTIQAVFNWWNYHLHEFRIGGLSYGNIEEFEEGGFVDDPRTFDEREVRLRDFRDRGTTFTYIYDFGDNWHHRVEIENFLSLDELPKHASCMDGARARPPEDVGGVPGYKDFLEIMSNAQNPDHADTKRWCGGHFDPEWFDPVMVDKDVKNALKPNVRRRLHQPKPKKSKPFSPP